MANIVEFGSWTSSIVNDILVNIYHRFPYPLRITAATLRGVYLRNWRYSADTERLVEEALERDYWGCDRWKSWQQEQLSQVLHRAATRVPYYREQWLARRRKGDERSWDYLENWPMLDKESVRKNAAAFVADDCSRRWMFHEHTSGTTGKSLDLWWSHKTVRRWYALFEARCRSWYGVSRRNRWAILGGQLIAPVANRRPPFWVWNAALNQLYMSSYHLAPDLVPYYLDALKQHRVEYIFGYSSSLYALAQEVSRLKRRDLQMIVAVTNAEPLFTHQRESISHAFQCPVRETYGMAEIVAGASECTAGQLHLWPEVGWIEVYENDHLVNNGAPGELVCTGLLNMDMPLIRYRVGDRASIRAIKDPCGCGRYLPTQGSPEGRIDDVLYTADGRYVGRLDSIFKDKLPVREAQIIQEAIDRVRVRYVPTEDFTVHAGHLIVKRLQERMGAVEVVLDEIEQIPRTKNGKFQSVIRRISS